MIPGIDPKIDYAFKKVFGSEANADLLRDLLESVLGFPVSAVEIINPFNEKDTPDDKLSIVDVKARDATGKLFDVEMQLYANLSLVPRLIYYWAKLYSGQLGEGQDYGELRPTYLIFFLDGKLSRLAPDVYHHHFELVDRNSGECCRNTSGCISSSCPSLPSVRTKSQRSKRCGVTS
jgi:predicted transposase/invertase (TIGR01784 family)